MNTTPHVSEEHRQLVDRAALALATAEDQAQAAQGLREAAVQALQALETRRTALADRVTSARAQAANRRLSEAEAADLNLALLDLGDLPPLIQRAQSDFATADQAMTAAGNTQALRQAELRGVRHHIQVDSARLRIKAAEAVLLQELATGWALAQSLPTQDRNAARLGHTLWSIWQPDNQLIRAATQHVPPSMPK